MIRTATPADAAELHAHEPGLFGVDAWSERAVHQGRVGARRPVVVST